MKNTNKKILDSFVNFSKNLSLFELEKSDFIRNDNHLFTFSPILDIEEMYQDTFQNTNILKKGAYKVQECFRQVFSSNLFNPLSVAYQNLYSIHFFEKIDNLKLINSFINDFLIKELNLDAKKIFIICANNGIEKLIKKDIYLQNEIIVIDSKRLKFKIPCIKGEHFYIKIVYAYNNGLVSIANFAVIDYTNLGFMLDSVVFENRLAFIMENKNYMYEIQKYENLYSKLLIKCNNQVNLVHMIISNFIAFIRIFLELKQISSKKQGYTARKLLIDIFNIMYYYGIEFNDDFLQILLSEFDFDEFNFEYDIIEIKNILNDTYIKFIKNISKNKRKCSKILEKEFKNQNINMDLVNEINSTYGISKYVLFKDFSIYFDNSIFDINNDNKNNFAYKFNLEENNFFDDYKNYK